MNRKVGVLIELLASGVALLFALHSYASGAACDWSAAIANGAAALGVLAVASLLPLAASRSSVPSRPSGYSKAPTA